MLKGKAGTRLKIFLTFLKIGAFTFGGGYAMIPLIQREIVEKHGWITDEDIFEIIAIAESTPGPIAINTATFVGSRISGFWGSFLATLGTVLPSFLVMLALSYVIGEVEHIKAVQYAFFGIRAGVLALIIKAFISMYKQCPKNVISYVLAAAAFVLAAFVKLNVLIVLIGCAAAGLACSLLAAGRKEK